MAPGRSSKEEIILTRNELFAMVKGELRNGLSSIVEHLEKSLTKTNGYPVKIRDEVKPLLSTLFSKMRTMWQTAGRQQANFAKKNKLWLDNTVSIPVGGTLKKKLDESRPIGRPSKEFASSSERSKRRKAAEIRTSFTSDELAYALQMNLRSEGKLDASKVVKDVAVSPSRASKYRTALKSSNEAELSDDAALAFMVNCKLTKSQYRLVRSVGREHNCRLHPRYKKVAQARQRCYPPKTTITFTETSAEVELQALLGHTLNRILLSKHDETRSLKFSHMELICKWGTSGQNSAGSDARVCVTSVIPVQLVCVNHETNERMVLWQNPKISSPRFCRVLIIQTVHENESTAEIDVVERVEEQIQSLVPFTRVLDNQRISISCKMELIAKVDDEVCNAASCKESSQRCYFCGTTSEDFNQIDAILKKDVCASDARFGLSIPHLWVRFFECCLHVSSQLGIKKWRASSEEEERITEDRKKAVRKGLGMELGVNVDRLQSECGSINNAYRARCFFKESSKSAIVTGLNEDLVNRFHVILQAISSGHEINFENFKDYGLETARYFFDLYPWYHMPLSIHTLLIHGPKVIASVLLPIGQLPQEVRYEYIERFHQNFAPSDFRAETIQHIFKRRLLTSDPYVSTIMELPCKKLGSSTRETVKMLLIPSAASSTGTTTRRAIDSDSDASSDSDVDSAYYVDSQSGEDSE